jgi:hypothetical protein
MMVQDTLKKTLQEHWMKTCGLLLGVLALSTTLTAIAETPDSGFYVGVGAGASDFDVDRGEVLAAALAVPNGAVWSFPMTTLPPLVPRSQQPGITPFTNRMFDHTDRMLAFVVGYTFNRYFSAEVSYTDLGEIRSQQVANLPLFSANFTSSVFAEQKVEIETFSVTALATLPISSRFKIFARGGFTLSQADSDRRIALLQAPLSFSLDSSMPLRVTAQSRTRDDSDSEGIVIGVGASFDVFKGFTLRADFTTLMDVSESAFASEVAVDTLGLTAIYRF